MDSSKMLPFILLISVPLIFISIAQPPLAYHSCIGSSYSMDDAYQTNLNRLPFSFPNTSTEGGFFKFSIGKAPERVSITALCRGDVGSDTCQSCINDSAVALPQICAYYKEAIGGYVSCVLRYSNRSIIGVEDSSSPFCMFNPNNVSSEWKQFDQTVRSLLYNLHTKAASGGLHLKFAVGDANITSYQKIYGLVQCTPDLSYSSCIHCLESATNLSLSCCSRKRGGRVIMPSCNVRFELDHFYQSTPAGVVATPPVALPTNTTTTSGGGSNASQTIIIVPVCVVFVILVIFICFYVWKRRKPLKKQLDEGVTKSVASLQFDFHIIRDATDNFSEANKLGQGGFGAVYKGRLSNGEEIAVKRLLMNSAQGGLEFKNEFMLLAKLQHRNLVRLLGFSLLENERLLIYEFVPNKSLDRFLSNEGSCSRFDWEGRYKIIGGIARGLLYLHEDSHLRIIHRDLKPGNVLLDAEMNPKIGDFGTARLFIVDQTQGHTSRVVGTHGYMAPEYARYGAFSVKSDVFSFGVLVLEIVSGQRILHFGDPNIGDDLLAFAWENWRLGTEQKLIDPMLVESPREDIGRCIQIGLLCVQIHVDDRPTMASVVLMLSSDSITLPKPSQPMGFCQDCSTSSNLDKAISNG